MLVRVVKLSRLGLVLLALAFVAASLCLTLPRPLPIGLIKVVILDTIGRLTVAPTHAPATLMLALVRLKLVAVLPILVANDIVVVRVGGAILRIRIAHLICILALLLLCLSLRKLIARVLVQIVVESFLVLELVISFGNWMTISLDLLNFV